MLPSSRFASRNAIACGLAACALIGFSEPAQSSVRIYNSSQSGGAPGDIVLYVVAACSPVMVTPGALEGHAALIDASAGTVTLDTLAIEQNVLFDIDTTAVFGPGAFFFATQAQSDRPLGNQTGTGSTAPLSSITWGVLSGWSSTGLSFCMASPAAVCANNGYLHGATVRPIPQSPTYDLGTWSFDEVGDYSATAYVAQTANGGESNVQWVLRGSYAGASVPALPIIGFGALAAGLLVAGTRARLAPREPNADYRDDALRPLDPEN